MWFVTSYALCCDLRENDLPQEDKVIPKGDSGIGSRDTMCHCQRSKPKIVRLWQEVVGLVVSQWLFLIMSSHFAESTE